MSINSIDFIKYSLHKQDKYKYLDAVQSSIPVKIDNSIETACINLDNNIILVNLDWFNSLPSKTMRELVIVHEYYHYIYDHGERAKQFKDCLNHEILNACADAEINTAIGLNDDNSNYFNNKNFVKIMSLGEDNKILNPETSFEQYCVIAKKYVNKYGNMLQSIADHLFDDCYFDKDGNNSYGNQQDIEKEVTKDLIRKQIIKDVRDDKHCPENISQKLNEILNQTIKKKDHKMLWSTVLKRIISKNVFILEGNGDYSTYTIINNYYSGLDDDVLFEGHYDLVKEIHIAVILDVSGSMINLQDKILSVLCSISNLENQVVVDVYYVDSEVLDVIYNLDNSYDFSEKLKKIDGGGTDMEVGIDACLKSSNYDNIIVMTDGYTDWKKSRSNIQKSLITVLLFNDEDKNKVPYTAYNVIS